MVIKQNRDELCSSFESGKIIVGELSIQGHRVSVMTVPRVLVTIEEVGSEPMKLCSIRSIFHAKHGGVQRIT